jgi:hypothetical protein
MSIHHPTFHVVIVCAEHSGGQVKLGNLNTINIIILIFNINISFIPDFASNLEAYFTNLNLNLTNFSQSNAIQNYFSFNKNTSDRKEGKIKN